VERAAVPVRAQRAVEAVAADRRRAAAPLAVPPPLAVHPAEPLRRHQLQSVPGFLATPMFITITRLMAVLSDRSSVRASRVMCPYPIKSPRRS
jgi:hypothetical protein